MATKVLFDGALRYLPGSYARTKSGVKNQGPNYSFGNVLFIDWGLGAGYLGGSGINGTFKSGKDSVESFDENVNALTYIKGGALYPVVSSLFAPSKNKAVKGVSNLLIIRACTTTPATITVGFTGAAFDEETKVVTPGINGGNLIIKPLDEGLIGNGAINTSSTLLIKGYGVTTHQSLVDVTKFYLKFWIGNYTGVDSYGIPYDGINEINSVPSLLFKSKDFNNFSELLLWCNNNADFKKVFYLDPTSAKIGTGAVTYGDYYTKKDSYVLGMGGTESYSNEDITSVLNTIYELDFTFALSQDFGSNAYSPKNLLLLDNLLSEKTKFNKFLVVGGGFDSDTFATQSIVTSQNFDSNNALVIHGGYKRTVSYISEGYRIYSQLVKAAKILGRICGLSPENPITFKDIDIDGEVHSLTYDDKVAALENGVIVSYYDEDFSKFCILEGVTSIQNNDNLVNEDDSSFSLQMKRIEFQLNKVIQQRAKIELFGNESGVNVGNISPSYLKKWTEGVLDTLVVAPENSINNLIIRWEGVTVTRNQDNYFVNYGFYPNLEVTKLFFTGVNLG